jgi:polysaccharide export outer membrane protein
MEELAPEVNATLGLAKMPLLPGDELAVEFRRSVEWKQERVLVRPDGRATFLGLGELVVAGRTVDEVRRDLVAAYEALGILEAPQLALSLLVPAERSFSVLGEVGDPGVYPLPHGPIGILEGLAMAGGYIRDTALLGHALLVRWVPDEMNIRSWRVDLSTGQFEGDATILLQAHDVLFIPPKAVVHVNDWIDRYIRRNLWLPFSTTGV